MWQNITIEKSPRRRKNVFLTEAPEYLAFIIISSIIACAILFFVEQFIGVSYIIKTAIKLLLFISIPFFYGFILKKESFLDILRLRNVNRESFLKGLLFGISFVVILIGGYYLLRSYIDLNYISFQLENNLGVNAKNFVYVALYISFINSFLEEFFFRGFVFLNLNDSLNKYISYGFSALIFALYHIGIFIKWFNPFIFFLSIAGLIIVGLLFDEMDAKPKNIINSWISHIMANCAIMFVGLIMFGIM